MENFTKTDCIKILTDLGLQKHTQGYSQFGNYILSHGEYSTPDFKIRKIRGSKYYSISVSYYYYSGTINAPVSGPAAEILDSMQNEKQYRIDAVS